MKFKAFALLALALAGAAAPASAQEDPNSIRFSGQSFGCFGENCTPGLTSRLGYLTFTGASFDQYTRPSTRSLTMFLGNFVFDNFIGQTVVESPFTLFLAFTNPTGIDPDPVYYTDIAGLVIRGKVNGTYAGSSTASVVFEPNIREYTFTGGDPDLAGRFTLELRDTNLDPTTRNHIVGKVTDATVTPEPISMILMGSGLAGIAAARRRRKQQDAV